MPVFSIITGETARDIANRIGVDHVGFDGIGCILFLNDGTCIRMEVFLTTELQLPTKELRFIHTVFDKEDNMPQKISEQY